MALYRPVNLFWNFVQELFCIYHYRSDIKEFEMKFAAFTDMDLDRLKIIPNDSWEFGYAANGMEKGRIIVRDSDNNDLCYQFGLSGSSYVCTTCRVGSHSAFYNEDIQRLVATKCKKLLPYVQIMSRQAKFRERWAANFQIHDSSTKMRSSRGMRHVEAFNPKRKRTSRKRPKIENSSSFELPEEPELTTHQSEDDTAMDTHDYDDLQSTSSVVTAISEFLPHNLENQTNDPEFEHFHRPSSYWINCTCRYFGLPVYTTDAYKTWASLRTINFKLENVLPPKNNVKEFDSGYDLISYLLTGSVNSSTIIDKKLNQYIYNNYKEFGVVDNIRCVDLTYEDIGNIVFNQSMQLLHFYAVSRLFKCVVVVYDYDKVKKSVFDHGSDATIVVGIDVDCCFLFC